MGPLSQTFSLYTAATCTPAQQVHAGQVFDLDTPLTEGGATFFRRSLWLPIPAAARSADTLAVAEGSTLALRFEARNIDARTDDTTWMPECALAGDFLHVALALPLPIVELIGTRSIDLALHRRDGDAVADDAVVGGRLNTPLSEQVSGVSFALKMSTYLEDRDFIRFEQTSQAHAHAKTAKVAKGANVAKAFGPPGDVGIVDGVVDDIIRAVSLVRRDGVLTAIRLAGRPTNPRMRLVRPAAAGKPEDTLWLDLKPGEQSAAQMLPADTPAKAWGPALAHCLADDAETAVADLTLRLDLESDAPCRITVQAVSLALIAETELLDEPRTLKFSGMRREMLAVPLASAAGPIESITVLASVDGDASAAAVTSATLPGDGRTGSLLGPDQRIVRALELLTPLRLCGISLPWHPLADQTTWTVQLCADAGGRPALPALIDATVAAATPGAAWMALRWPPLDLQGGRYWLRLVATEGSGLWLHAASGEAVAGWTEAAKSPQLNPLPLGGVPAVATLTASATPPDLALRLGAHALTLVPSAQGSKLSALLSFSPPAMPATDLETEASQPITLKLESARIAQRL